MSILKSFFKPSVLISIGLATGVGIWLASGAAQTGEENPQDQTKEAALNDEGSKVAKKPSYKTSVRYLESHAQNHQSTVTITGQTKFDRSVTVRAETFGQVTKINMEESFPIKKGKLIAQLEIEDRGAQIKKAKALLKQREIQFEAATKLAKKGFNSQIKKSEAEANLESAKTSLRVAEINYSNTSMKSPFSGIVQVQHVEIGDYVQKGDPIATILDMDPIYIVAYVSEKEINTVEQGSLSTVKLIDGAELEGIVSHISPIALETTRSFKVEVEVPNEGGKIRSGLTASVSLPLGSKNAHLISPALLTLNNSGQVGVKYLDEKDIVHFNLVTIIEDTEKGIWVDGLPSAIRIIAVGQEFVNEGAKVIATPLAQSDIQANS